MTVLTTDFHTHILPGIDDGSASVDESIKMLKMQQEQGVQTTLLTPHFYAQQMYPDTFLEKRKQSLDRLKAALPTDLASMRLVLGAEVHFYSGISQWEQLRDLAIGDSDYILIEMPSTKWTYGMYEELSSIYQFHGLTPILAHIDRYFLPFQANKMLHKLSELPVLLQLNCDFLIDKHTRRQAIRLLKNRKVHMLGSDCHNTSTRMPCMSSAREVLFEYTEPEIFAFLSQIESSVFGK